MRRYTTPAPTTPSIYITHIPASYPGTRRTLEHVQSLIRAGAKDFYVRQKAIDILLERRVKPKDYLGEVKALFEWVQHSIRYTKDPYQVETLHSPQRMLQLRAGDCDDMTTLLGALLESIGHPVRLAIVGPDMFRPKLFTHIYLEVFCAGRWIALDPTMPYPMGWSPRTLVKEVFAIERRPNMLSQAMEMEMKGMGDAAMPHWLRGLVRAIHGEAMQPKDERVRRLWNILLQRGLLQHSAWLRQVLRRVWRHGLAANPRPITTRRFVRLLRSWGMLPPRQHYEGQSQIRPLQPVSAQSLPYATQTRGYPPRSPMTIRRLR